MSPELVSAGLELGVAGAALFLFYKIIENMQLSHRKDRELDSSRWREEIANSRHGTEKALSATEAALRELSVVIRETRK